MTDRSIDAIALDVDGVLTDGSFYWGPDGQEWKRFCFSDVMGISLAKRSGIVFGLISGEAGPLIDRYAEKMSIEHLYSGCKDKAAAIRSFSEAVGIGLERMAFMGDDVNDLPALELVGLRAAPRTARPDVLAIANFVSDCAGGDGAVRDLVDFILGQKSSREARISRDSRASS